METAEWRCTANGVEAMVISCKKRTLNIKETFLEKECLGTGTCFPEIVKCPSLGTFKT